MKRYPTYFLFVLATLLFSCTKTELKQAFPCSGGFENSQTKKYTDVLKKFKLRIPKNWKTELYYDQYVSEIFSADTTKQLSETYIIDVVWHRAELEINPKLINSIKARLDSTGMKTVEENKITYKKYPAYYNLAKGKFKQLDYHLLQVVVKVKPDEYFSFTTKVYGDERVRERICESVDLYESFTVLDN